MFLANCNIQEIVTKHVNAYLKNEDLSYTELKALLLSKTPIPQIQRLILSELNKGKESDLESVQKKLEEQAFKAQLQEDKNQKEKDRIEEEKDAIQKDLLKTIIKNIPTELSEQESELRVLNGKLMRLIESQMQVEIIAHPNNKKHVPNPAKMNNASIERVRRSISEHEAKIQLLFEKDFSSKKELRALDLRAKNRLDRQDKRDNREQARVGYKTTGEGIYEALSTKNRSLLNQNIKKQRDALELKLTNLIQESEHINYPIFIEELECHLNAPPAHLSAQETRALLACLKLMHKHIEFAQEYMNAISSLSRKKQSISALKTKQFELQGKLKALSNGNPKLTGNNEALNSKNLVLKETLAKNNAWRQKLTTSTLLLAGITLVFVIPLILTISGTIPFFISPALLYALVITPPATLLLATIGTGIAALVYYLKAKSNESQLKANLKTIQSNETQMNRNSQQLKSLEVSTLPSLESQIQREESLREQLINSLTKSKSLAEQTLKQASEIEPISYSSSPFLSKKSASPIEKEETAPVETREENSADEEETETASIIV